MRELYFREAVEKYGASEMCNLVFEMRIVNATATTSEPLAVLGEIRTNCGHDAFLQLKKEYSAVVKKYGTDAMFELQLK